MTDADHELITLFLNKYSFSLYKLNIQFELLGYGHEQYKYKDKIMKGFCRTSLQRDCYGIISYFWDDDIRNKILKYLFKTL